MWSLRDNPSSIQSIQTFTAAPPPHGTHTTGRRPRRNASARSLYALSSSRVATRERLRTLPYSEPQELSPAGPSDPRRSRDAPALHALKLSDRPRRETRSRSHHLVATSAQTLSRMLHNTHTARKALLRGPSSLCRMLQAVVKPRGVVTPPGERAQSATACVA